VVGDIRFSPDRESVALAIQDAEQQSIYGSTISHVEIRTRLTFDSATDSNPCLVRDGRAIIFRSTGKGTFDLYRKSVDSVGAEELLYATDLEKTPTSWSPDGKTLLYNTRINKAAAYDGTERMEAASDGPGECVLETFSPAFRTIQ